MIKDINELEEILLEKGCEGATYLTDPDYLSAIIGTDEDGRVVYDYELMIEHLVKYEGMDTESAADFLNYSTLFAISLMGDKRPIVVTSIHNA